MMDILLVNDDGIYSEGILELKHEISNELNNEDINITIVAPISQQSGVGRSISLYDPIRISKTKLSDGSCGYAVSGTPADCVILGIHKILNKTPDMVVSGINIGENIGTEITTSGTVGAAFEGAHHGAKAIASSIQVDCESNLNFKTSAKITAKIVKEYLYNGFNCDVINLNFPITVKEDTPIEITKLARRMYHAQVNERTDPRNRSYYWISGAPTNHANEGTDIHTLMSKKNISLTPLTLDTTINNFNDFARGYQKIIDKI